MISTTMIITIAMDMSTVVLKPEKWETPVAVGVADGEVVAEGNVTVLLVGMKKACTATSWSTTNESELSVEVVPPLA